MKNNVLSPKKKSFAIKHNGGAIWCVNLSGFSENKEQLKQKFTQELKKIEDPATSSFLALVLNDTVVDSEIMNLIISSFLKLQRPLRKVAFVGLDNDNTMYIKKISMNLHFAAECADSLDEAKEWLF